MFPIILDAGHGGAKDHLQSRGRQGKDDNLKLNNFGNLERY